MSSQQSIYRHLTDDGLKGDDSNDMANVNGAVTPVPFWYGPTEGIVTVHRMIVTIEDNAVLAADNYGGLSALTNGLQVRVMEGNQTTGNVELDLLDGGSIKSHLGWAEHCYDLTEHVFGAGNNFIVVRWTFSNAGRPLILNSVHQDKLVVTVNDDLSTLVAHHFQIQGHVINQIDHQLNSWGA